MKRRPPKKLPPWGMEWWPSIMALGFLLWLVGAMLIGCTTYTGPASSRMPPCMNGKGVWVQLRGDGVYECWDRLRFERWREVNRL